jgi:hypothetical protein
MSTEVLLERFGKGQTPYEGIQEEVSRSNRRGTHFFKKNITAIFDRGLLVTYL